MPPLGRENFDGSLRVAKISRSHRPALAPPGVARRSPPTRIGRPEVKTNQCFSQNGAQRSSFRGTPKVAGRRAGVSIPPAACSRGTPTDHRRGYRCGVARTTSIVDCVGSTTALRSRRAVGVRWSRRALSDTGLIMSPKMRRHCEQISPSSATMFEHPARTHPVNICGSTIVSAFGALTIGIGFRAVRRRARLGRKPDSPVRVRSVRRRRRGGSRPRAGRRLRGRSLRARG